MILPSVSTDADIPTTLTQANIDFDLLAQEVGNCTDGHTNNTTIENVRVSVRRTNVVMGNQVTFTGVRALFPHPPVTHSLGKLILKYHLRW